MSSRAAINVSVSSHYREASYASEVTSQGILGEQVEVIELAREFLGYQYVWGGRTPKGFDCSGLVQTTFGLLGIQLPRDSRQRQRDYFRSADIHDAESGDLLFFGASEENITHVAISLGDLRFIHASGWVRYNSFRRSDPDFSQKHLDTFISVNRYPLMHNFP